MCPVCPACPACVRAWLHSRTQACRFARACASVCVSANVCLCARACARHAHGASGPLPRSLHCHARYAPHVHDVRRHDRCRAARLAALTRVRESRRIDEARGRFVGGFGRGWRRKGGFGSRRRCGRRHSRARCGTTRWQRAAGRRRRRCRCRRWRRMLRRIRLSSTASHAENAVRSCKATLAPRTPWGPIALAAGPLGRTRAAARCR